jgi:cardiolipin synthase
VWLKRRRTENAKFLQLGVARRIPVKGKITFKVILLLQLLISLLIWRGCASVPSPDYWIRNYAHLDRPPAIFTSQGDPLSPEQSRRVIQGLEKRVGPTPILHEHLLVVEESSGEPLISGNRVTLLVDGPAAFSSMIQAMEAAKDHIHLEFYIFNNDEMGRRIADLLLKKRASGVQVNLIYDSLGCQETPKGFFDLLRKGGIQVVEFNPLNPLKRPLDWDASHRDHRKILIVDGTVAFTGGINISDDYSSSSSPDYTRSKRPPGWRDTDIRVEGPAVEEFQKFFIEAWKGETGIELKGSGFYPQPKPQGEDLVRVITSTPEYNRNPYIMYVSALTFARKTVHLTNSYFVSDQDTLEALEEAARRGMDVKIILPAVNDHGTIYYAGRSYYTLLLKAGVKIFERHSAVLHAKTAVIDGVLSTVGSTNLERWSLMRSNELNAMILSDGFAKEMEDLFETDLELSNEILLPKWEERPFYDRLKELFGRMIAFWL